MLRANFPLCYKKRPPILPRGRTGGRLLELVLVLVDYTATVHRPTVPPRGERTVIVVIAITVCDHRLNQLAKDTHQPSLSQAGYVLVARTSVCVALEISQSTKSSEPMKSI